MSARVRHPAISFALFLLLCGMGWAAYENRDVFQGSPAQELLGREAKDRLRESIQHTMEGEPCFLEVRGHLNWRPNEHRYLLDLVLADGELCELKADAICEQVARQIQDEASVVATVVAYDLAGRELGRKVR